MRKARLYALIIFSAFTLRTPCAGASEHRAAELIMKWQLCAATRLMENLDPSDELMGIYSFYSGDYKQAFTLLEGSGSAFELLAAETKAAASGFSELRDGYFVIRFTGRDHMIAARLGKIMNSAAEKLHETFDWRPQRPVIVEIYPDRDSFRAASTLSEQQIRVSGAVGICKFNRIMILSPGALMFGYRWPSTAVHEYVHYIVGKTAGGPQNVPLWLNEGLAKRFEEIWSGEGGLTPAEKNYLIRTSRSDSWICLERMRYGMPTLETSQEVRLAFAQVHSMVRFLEDTRGRDKFPMLLRKFEKSDAESALMGVYGSNAGDILDEWSEYIKRKGLDYTPGASSPSFAFSDDPASAATEWMAEAAAAEARIAGMFERRGSYRAAERKYKDALSRNPGCSVILTSLARVQKAIGEKGFAEINLKKAVMSNPSYPPPYIRLAKLFAEKGDYARALRYADEYTYYMPYNPEAYNIIRSAAEREGLADRVTSAEEAIRFLNAR